MDGGPPGGKVNRYFLLFYFVFFPLCLRTGEIDLLRNEPEVKKNNYNRSDIILWNFTKGNGLT